MQSLRSIKPSPALESYVERYVFYQIKVNAPRAQDLIPSNMQNIGFVLSGNMQSNALTNHSNGGNSYVLGQQTNPVDVTYFGDLKVLAIHFRPSGMYQLFGIPMTNFTNQGLAFDSIMNKDEKRLIEKLYELDNIRSQIEVLEKLLLKRLSGRSPNTVGCIAYASDLMVTHCGTIPISRLARQVNMSERNFERHFSMQVGVPPKAFSGIVRMRKALQLIECKPEFSWKDIAYTLMYTDQAHFVHDFKKFAGKTPTEYCNSKSLFEQSNYSQ